MTFSTAAQQQAPDPWLVPTPEGPLNGHADVPGSKSESNRALVLATLSDGPSTIKGLLDARDTRLMIAALSALGTTISPIMDGSVHVTPGPLHAAAAPIDCGLAGTVLRFVPPLAGLAGGMSAFIGDERASERPVGPLLDGLRQLGAAIDGDAIPFTVSAPDGLSGRSVIIDSSASSQFISGLLLTGARMPNGLDIRHSGDKLPSVPHIQMTTTMLARHGVQVSEPEPGHWIIEPGVIAAADERIEPDLTNAAVFLIAGVLSGGSVVIDGWPRHSTQPGALIGPVLARMGASFMMSADGASACATDALVGCDLDLAAASELTCSVAGLAVAARGITTIRGIGHIRGHETDRITAIATELSRLGVPVKELPEGLEITGMAGRLNELHPSEGDGYFHCYADHRMAHLGALMGLLVPGITLDDAAATSKTMPDFPQRWASLVGEMAKESA